VRFFIIFELNFDNPQKYGICTLLASVRRRKNEGMFPPAASVICGTMAGLCFWGFLAPEGGLCSRAEEGCGTDGICCIQEVFLELMPAILPIAFGVTVLVAVVFVLGVFLFRRTAPPRPVFFSGKPKKYLSVSYLRYRYGKPLFRLGLLALFCMGFWHGLIRQMPAGELSRVFTDSLVPEGEQVFLCLRVRDFPVHVTTGSGRRYVRMECRLVLYSPDGREQIPGNENIQAYVLVDTTGGSGLTAGERVREPPTQWLPGDILITRCRTFPFAPHNAATPSATTSGSTAIAAGGDSVPDSANTNTTAFDYRTYMARRGFFRRAYIYNFQRVSGKLTVIERLKRVRVPITRSWEGEAGALLSGICLGDKTSLTPEIRERFSEAGAGHILAVSGLHVGILYGSLVLLLSLPFRIGESRRYKYRRNSRINNIRSRELALRRTYSLTRGTWIHIPALLLIWSYAAVVGFSASVVRAALMLTVYGVGKMTGRRAFGLNVLSLTALILVILEPMKLYDIGFQMSFCAVLGLILFFPLLRNLLRVRNRLLKYIWELFCCSLAVQLGTLWLTTASFGIIPLYGLLCNLAVVPFCTIILHVFLCYLILLGSSTLFCFSPVYDFTQSAIQSLNEVLHCLAGWLEKTVSFFAELPYTPIYYQPGPGGQILILFCTLVVYILLRRNDRNP
jgi:ComEC/Rec2-related protein